MSQSHIHEVIETANLPETWKSACRAFEKPSSGCIECRTGLSHLTDHELDLGSRLRTQLTICELNLGVFKVRQLLIHFADSGLQRGSAILCHAQRRFRAIEFGLIAGERGSLRRSSMARRSLFCFSERRRQAIAVCGYGVNIALHRFSLSDDLKRPITTISLL
ncbi:hypothetical protein H8B02_39210 [Bradyrhizobium sp. Pear77]|uniref:hypothetical protein n=1 Tax=Bradyrhizobium TaxID=374 RepID=UPI001E6138F1|nr:MULTISPECIES: hypothetical protein [Bradyrhizobium]MCC8959220.1 hypothetical protein [Bradyrhizobium altum]MCC8968351.1 hypothetical protein [Bradyrhizobium oropedii]